MTPIFRNTKAASSVGKTVERKHRVDVGGSADMAGRNSSADGCCLPVRTVHGECPRSVGETVAWEHRVDGDGGR